MSPLRLAVIHQAMIIRFYWRMERDHVICGRQDRSDGVKGQQILIDINWGRMKLEVLLRSLVNMVKFRKAMIVF